MTRGTIYLILENTIAQTTEFNGDMYRNDGHYEEVVSNLLKIKNVDQFCAFAEKFNQKYYKYNNQIVFAKSKPTGEETFDFWSDYNFFKNASNEDFALKLERSGETHIIKPEEIFVSYFDTPDLHITADHTIVDWGYVKGNQRSPLNKKLIKNL